MAMNTRNWFGEHAESIRMIALAGGIALAAIIVLDILASKKKGSSTTNGAAPATGADTSPATSGTSATSTLQNPGETYISILEDYSSHVSNSSTSNGPILAPGPSGGVHLGGGVQNYLPPVSSPTTTPTPVDRPVGHPASTGGATVPVPTPHPAQQYTVRSGDSLWSIASRFLGNGADWTELYNWNRSTVGNNSNLIYPGEVLNINN